jgi:sec-independent protein translocase protein TatA
MSALFAFGLGGWEILVVALVVLLLFGNRLPGLMRSLGQGVVEFKKGVQGIEEDEDAGASREKKAP